MDGSILQRSLDVLVLMGGPSEEREISLLSGKAVAEALAQRGHRVRTADITPTDTSALEGDHPDVVFIAMHGEFGEDGQVQQLCEDRQLAYVGSSPRACERAMDKAAAKQVYRRIGLATPDWVVVEQYDKPDTVAELIGRIGLPCVVKPVLGGSSQDVFLCDTESARKAALDELLDKYTRALVEKRISGRELTVGVLGTRALPVIEIRTDRPFYDYQAKYLDDDTQYIFDHGLPDELVETLQDAAVSAHGALGCLDISRSDFVLDDDGVVWILETNIIPGLTSHSLLPKAAACEGLAFGKMCEMLVKMAMNRAASRR